MELYNGKARDLLSKDKFLTGLAIRENKDKTFFCEVCVFTELNGYVCCTLACGRRYFVLQIL